MKVKKLITLRSRLRKKS